MVKYLSSRALEGLKRYAYKPSGYTILDTIHTPFWNWTVERLPLWLAPNLITLIGTMFLVVAYGINAYYAPDFVAPPGAETPRWVFLFSAFAVWAYCQLDCLDGKQARRTRSSSPLGQLFDHGCDALSVGLLLGNIACTLALPCGWAHGLGMFGVMFTWILAQWEEYHTGIMLYGNSFYGVLEANYSISLLHIITFFTGPNLWHTHVTDLVPQLADIPQLKDVQANEAAIVVLITVGFYQAACNLYRVATADPATLPAKERGHKQLGPGPAVGHFVILTMLLALGCIWLWQPCSEPWLCRLENANMGLTYAFVASQLIMAHMCKEPFEPAMWAIGQLAVGAVNRRLHVVDPLALTAGLTLAVLTGYLHYVFVVIGQICEFLDINCLTIKRKAE